MMANSKAKFQLCRVGSTTADNEGVVRSAKVQLHPKDSQEALLPYKHKAPTYMETGNQGLLLIVPAEELVIGVNMTAVSSLHKSSATEHLGLGRKPIPNKKNQTHLIKSANVRHFCFKELNDSCSCCREFCDSGCSCNGELYNFCYFCWELCDSKCSCCRELYDSCSWCGELCNS